MSNNFVKKGYGRVYVFKEEDIEKVKNLMRQVDAYEFDGYFPKDLVSLYPGEVDLIYTHKFEMDMDTLTKYCIDNGIFVWCISQHNEYFEPSPLSPPLE